MAARRPAAGAWASRSGATRCCRAESVTHASARPVGSLRSKRTWSSHELPAPHGGSAVTSTPSTPSQQLGVHPRMARRRATISGSGRAGPGPVRRGCCSSVVEADLFVLVPGEWLAGLGGPEPRLSMRASSRRPASHHRCRHDLVAVERVDTGRAHGPGGAVEPCGARQATPRHRPAPDAVHLGDGQEPVVVGGRPNRSTGMIAASAGRPTRPCSGRSRAGPGPGPTTAPPRPGTMASLPDRSTRMPSPRR